MLMFLATTLRERRLEELLRGSALSSLPPSQEVLAKLARFRRCITFPMVPVSQAFVYDSWTTPGASLQAGFVDFPLVFLICPASLHSTTPNLANAFPLPLGQQPGLIISLPILGPILDPIVSILLPASETTTTVEAPPTTTTSFSSSSASVTPTTTALTTKSKGRGIATYPTTTSTTTTSTTSRTFTTTARSRGVVRPSLLPSHLL